MKTLIAMITLSLLAAPALARHQDDDPEQQQSITNIHADHFPHTPGDNHDPERGEGEEYGSILLDVEPNVARASSK